MRPYRIGVLDLNLRVGRGIDVLALIVGYGIAGPIYHYWDLVTAVAGSMTAGSLMETWSIERGLLGAHPGWILVFVVLQIRLYLHRMMDVHSRVSQQCHGQLVILCRLILALPSSMTRHFVL